MSDIKFRSVLWEDRLCCEFTTMNMKPRNDQKVTLTIGWCVCMHVWACASNSLLKCFQNINFYYYVTSVLPWIRYRGAKNELHVKLFVVQHERMNRIKMWHPYVNRYFRVAMPHTYTCLSGKIDDDNIIQMHLKYDEKKEKPKPKEKCVRRFVLFWFELAINAEYGSLSRK